MTRKTAKKSARKKTASKTAKKAASAAYARLDRMAAAKAAASLFGESWVAAAVKLFVWREPPPVALAERRHLPASGEVPRVRG